MDDLKERVQASLEHAFDGAVVEMEDVPQSRKIGGLVVWSGFDGLEQLDRQDKVWSALEGLTREETLRITAILTLTPDELPDTRERPRKSA